MITSNLATCVPEVHLMEPLAPVSREESYTRDKRFHLNDIQVHVDGCVFTL